MASDEGTDKRDLRLARAPAGVNTVKISAQILDIISESEEPCRLTDLAKVLDTTKTKVARHLTTLKELNYIQEASRGSGYILGWRLIQLGQSAARQFDLSAIARPYLVALSDKIGETVILSVPSLPNVVTMLCIESDRGVIKITIRDGTVLHWPASPAAQIVVAHAPEAIIGQLLSALPEAEELRSRLRRNLERARTAGYLVEVDVFNNGIGAIAAPILDRRGVVRGVISLPMSSSHLSGSHSAMLAPDVLACARAISDELAGQV